MSRLHYVLAVAASGPDLNSVDYAVWEILSIPHRQIYRNQIKDVEELRQPVE